MSAKDRRGFIKTVAAGVAGLAIGGIGGFLASSMNQQPTTTARTETRTVTLRETITQTVTGAASPRTTPTTPLKVGVINPLSGGGAPLGDPGAKGGLLAVELINQAGGILGRRIEVVGPIDTVGLPDRAVDAVTRLVQQEGCRIIIGEVTSAAGLAIADAADRLGFLWMPCEVWTPRVFETRRKFTFRLSWSDAAAGVGAALMALRIKPDVRTIATINQDYAHGRDNWESFRSTIQALKPDVRVVEELWFPLYGLTDATPFITRLMAARPDIVQSTIWGSDRFVFYRQAVPAGYFRTVLHLDTCLTGMDGHNRETWPDGLYAGSQYNRFYPPWDLWPINKEFNEAFIRRFGQPAFAEGAQSAANMFTNFLALKQAIEKAAATVGGWPEIDEVAQAMVGMRVIGPKGIITIREDHEFEGPQVWARTKYVSGVPYPIVDPNEVVTFPAELTVPPPGVAWREWVRNYKIRAIT
ncbi:MAG: ABC transporter substrate-binding protein [Aigarchaeota archaeon]|nr:ABC transporter substrate-binding protein [Aigarchaeota archaeon]MDW8092065.1 ABC transporter substrate-binding protein [Nitrososphaerota archaeon]